MTILVVYLGVRIYYTEIRQHRHDLFLALPPKMQTVLEDCKHIHSTQGRAKDYPLPNYREHQPSTPGGIGKSTSGRSAPHEAVKLGLN